jgi:hypothetical protein
MAFFKKIYYFLWQHMPKTFSLEGMFHSFRWNIYNPLCHFFKMQAPTDWWNAYHFMSKAILPYLQAFKKAEKQGYPVLLQEIFKEDLPQYNTTSSPPFIRTVSIEGVTEDDPLDTWCREKWAWVIDEIIFAVKYSIGENDDDCLIPNPLYNPKQKECIYTIPCADGSGCHELHFHEDYGKMKTDYGLLNKKQIRVQNGFKLLGQFWQCIWD